MRGLAYVPIPKDGRACHFTANSPHFLYALILRPSGRDNSQQAGVHEALNNSGKFIAYGNLEAWLHGILEYDNDEIYCIERQKSLQAARFFKNDVAERFKKIIMLPKADMPAPELNFP